MLTKQVHLIERSGVRGDRGCKSGYGKPIRMPRSPPSCNRGPLWRVWEGLGSPKGCRGVNRLFQNGEASLMKSMKENRG